MVGQYRWKRDEAGRPVLSVDTTHLNRFGEYLQACVWFGALFGTDVREIGYAPSFVSPDMAALLRSCAARALAGKTAVRASGE